jgi:sugar (pentulose or hexulose) kinase
MKSKPVIAIFDVGKTNKKLIFFDQQYNIVDEYSGRFMETVDEDGDPCENIDVLKQFIFDSLQNVNDRKEFQLAAVNFSAYGASFVYVDESGTPLTPLYNYLKPYPPLLKQQFYNKYGGEEMFSLQTASPVLDSLNSGMQLYRLKYEHPEVFAKLKYALHLPQYLSYLVTGKAVSDITSIGCHTNLWDFKKHNYHSWVKEEGLEPKLAPVVNYNNVVRAFLSDHEYIVGSGLHDSSAALIPYMISFQEPFVLLSTGTWCISLNPFNHQPLTKDELDQDCLCYLHHGGKPVKASRLFAGIEHDEGVKRISDHFQQDPLFYRSVDYDPVIIARLQKKEGVNTFDSTSDFVFKQRGLNDFTSFEEAYHQLMLDIVRRQVRSTLLVLTGSPVKRIFVDGGFSKNKIFMNLLAAALPQFEIYAAFMSQATSLGTALAIHTAWNKNPVPGTLITFQHYAVPQSMAL